MSDVKKIVIDFNTVPSRKTKILPGCISGCWHMLWRTADRVSLKLCQMEDGHLLNTERLIREDFLDAFTNLQRALPIKSPIVFDEKNYLEPLKIVALEVSLSQTVEWWLDEEPDACDCFSRDGISVMDVSHGLKMSIVHGHICGIHLLFELVFKRLAELEEFRRTIRTRDLEPKAIRPLEDRPDYVRRSPSRQTRILISPVGKSYHVPSPDLNPSAIDLE